MYIYLRTRARGYFARLHGSWILSHLKITHTASRLNLKSNSGELRGARAEIACIKNLAPSYIHTRFPEKSHVQLCSAVELSHRARFMNSRLNCTLCIRAHSCARLAAKKHRYREGGMITGVQTAPRVRSTMQRKIVQSHLSPSRYFSRTRCGIAECFQPRPTTAANSSSGVECWLNDTRETETVPKSAAHPCTLHLTPLSLRRLRIWCLVSDVNNACQAYVVTLKPESHHGPEFKLTLWSSVYAHVTLFSLYVQHVLNKARR